MPGPDNGNVFFNMSHNQSLQAPPQTSNLHSYVLPSGQAGPHQLLPYCRQPIPTNPMAPTWSQLTPFCQPSLMKGSSAASLAAGYSSFPTVHGFPLPPAPLQQQHGLNSQSSRCSLPPVQHFLQFTIPRYQQHPISSKLLTPRHFTIRLHQHKAPWHH